MVGRGGPGTEGAWLLNSRGGNNGAVALATRGGLSLGLKAESGKRCPKKGRLGTEGVGWGCLFSELSAPPQGRAAGAPFQERVGVPVDPFRRATKGAKETSCQRTGWRPAQRPRWLRRSVR